MSGCERFDRVILSDFLEVNRRELQSWLQEGKSSIDWTAYFKYGVNWRVAGEIPIVIIFLFHKKPKGEAQTNNFMLL